MLKPLFKALSQRYYKPTKAWYQSLQATCLINKQHRLLIVKMFKGIF
ncbi:hypothetical protein KVL07_00635 [Helicobacter pylori]|nr:hypothetical protein KVL07_00635 [Helicobacter pylori]